MLSVYFEILGVSQNASEEEIRKAYRKKAKEFHPDLNKSPDANQQFLLIQKAYEVLINKSNTPSGATVSGNPMTSYEAYMRWKHQQEEKNHREAQARHEDFLQNRARFRKSIWYIPVKVFIIFAVVFSYLFATAIIFLCAYIVHKTHIIFVFLLLPFIAGAIFFIKSTSKWFKEAKQYF